jgi:hypothetical protein
LVAGYGTDAIQCAFLSQYRGKEIKSIIGMESFYEVGVEIHTQVGAQLPGRIAIFPRLVLLVGGILVWLGLPLRLSVFTGNVAALEGANENVNIFIHDRDYLIEAAQ